MGNSDGSTSIFLVDRCPPVSPLPVSVPGGMTCVALASPQCVRGGANGYYRLLF
eukprot:m.185338 g.185338  ORF g.185338 m.185338 type:complete len:54 (-) comp16414_c0_seq1:54-215(-)